MAMTPTTVSRPANHRDACQMGRMGICPVCCQLLSDFDIQGQSQSQSWRRGGDCCCCCKPDRAAPGSA